jgi:hypothetical protein
MSLLRLFKHIGSDPTKYVDVNNADTARTTSTVVAAVQIIDATGKVAPAGEAVGNAPFVKLTDGTNTISIGSGVPIIDAVHYQIHSGNAFIAQRLFTSVGVAANADIRILNGATKELHLKATIIAESKAYFYIYEGTTYSANGTGLTAYNSNRTSATATTGALYYTPTVNVLGTAIKAGMLLAGGSITDREEIMLKKSTDYLFRVTNTSGVISDISIALEWYEL